MADADDFERLGKGLVARMSYLGIGLRALERSHHVNVKTLGRMRAGESAKFTSRTRRAVEAAVGWKELQIDKILAGGPVPPPNYAGTPRPLPAPTPDEFATTGDVADLTALVLRLTARVAALEDAGGSDGPSHQAGDGAP